MSYSASDIQLASHDRAFLSALVLGAFFVLAGLVLVLWKIQPLAEAKPYLALHYNVFFGVDAIGPWKRLLLLPGAGALVLFTNVLVALGFFPREQVLSRTCLLSAVVVNLVLFVATFFIVLANT